MSDNKWTALAAVASAVSGIACGVFNRRGDNTRTPELHERVALLEKAVEELRAKVEDEQ